MNSDKLSSVSIPFLFSVRRQGTRTFSFASVLRHKNLFYLHISDVCASLRLPSDCSPPCRLRFYLFLRIQMAFEVDFGRSWLNAV